MNTMKNFLTILLNFLFRRKPEVEESKRFGNCPINEQTADGAIVGRCWHSLDDGTTCPRHGDVSIEIAHFNETGELTLENKQRKRTGKPLLG